MPKIKTKKYDINGKDYDVDFYCSKDGFFSAKMDYELSNILNINLKTYAKISDLEKEITDAYERYKKEVTTYSLKIGVKFGASGLFRCNPDGTFERVFQYDNNRRRFEMPVSSFEFMSALRFDYRILIEEKRDSRCSYYETMTCDQKYGIPVIKVGDYTDSNIARKAEDEILIDYSDTILYNLKSITEQLRNASFFLANILASDNMSQILSSENLRALK